MARHPQRTCIGCRKVTDQGDLVRIVWDVSQQRVVADPMRNVPGRGAYLHGGPDCLSQACRRRAIGRALRRADVDHEEISIRLAVSWENHPDSR